MSPIALLSDAIRSDTQVSAPLEGKAVAALGMAWMIRVLRTAETIAELHHRGLGDAAPPMVRSVMEHAISMLWLVKRRAEAVKAIEFGHRRYQGLLRDSAMKGGWDLSQLDEEMAGALLDLAMEKPEDWPRLERFEHRMQDPTIRSWYPAYRIESSLSHASYLSGAIYVDDDGTFNWDPVVPATPLRATAVFAILAAEALNELLLPSPALLRAVDEGKALLGNRTGKLTGGDAVTMPDSGEFRHAARAFLRVAWEALARDHVAPTPWFHPHIEVGRGYFGHAVMGVAEYERLENLVVASHPRFSDDASLAESDFPGQYIFSFLQAFVARSARQSGPFASDADPAEESIDDLGAAVHAISQPHVRHARLSRGQGRVGRRVPSHPPSRRAGGVRTA